MEVVQTIKALRSMRRQWEDQRARVSLVPTMGALHAGHLSLVDRARSRAGKVVVSIFVNPTQFGPHEDLNRYPRTLDADLRALGKKGADAVFVPSIAEMYPDGYQTSVSVEELNKKLCGASRPGHFKGVTTVVLKLFNLVHPDVAFFGQKDAQQALIIQRMVRDVNLEVDIEICPIVREGDGLALSSRNRYLKADERRAAPALHRSLRWAEEQVNRGERDAGRLVDGVRHQISQEPLARLDYAEIVDPQSLDTVSVLEGRTLLALAVFFGTTRLIDNTYLES